MEINFLPAIIFLATSMISPGPNNITGGSLGIMYGYRKSFKYVLGVGAGLFVIMSLSGLLSGVLHKAIPGFEKILRTAGSIYILWLATGLLRTTIAKENTNQSLLGFTQGLMLQFLNPKVIVMGVTLYSTFLLQVTTNYLWLAVSALILGVMAFCFTSLWTAAGSLLLRNLKKPVILKSISIGLALLLVYSAVELSGFLRLFLN